MRVTVTNNGAAWSGRFDGEPYEFPAGESVTIPERAAMFFFAFGMDDGARARVLVRNGWQQNGIPGHELGPESAKKRLMAFSFKTAPDVERVKPAPKVLGPAVVTSIDKEAAKKAKAEEGAPLSAEEQAILQREQGNVTITLPGRKGPPAPAAAAS